MTVEQATLIPVDYNFEFCPKCGDLMVRPHIARSKDLEHDIGGCERGAAICSPCGFYEGIYGTAIEHYAGQWGDSDPYRSWEEICVEIGDDLWESEELEERRANYRALIQNIVAMKLREAEARVAALKPIVIPPESPWSWLKGDNLR